MTDQHFTLCIAVFVLVMCAVRVSFQALDAALKQRWASAAYNALAVYGYAVIAQAVWRVA